MKKKRNWESLPQDDKDLYLDCTINAVHNPLLQQTSTLIGLKELQRLHQTELEEQRGNFNNMFKRWGKELFEKLSN